MFSIRPFYPFISYLFDIGRGTYVEKTYQFLIRSQWWEPERIRELQSEKLKKLLHYAYQNIPYYNSIFKYLDLSPGDIKSIQDLKKIPILTKSEIRKNFPKDIVAKNYAYRFEKHASGGSIGEPIVFYKDIHTKSIAMAAQKRSWEWAGYREGDRVGTFWGNPDFVAESKTLKKRIKNLLYREILFPACELNNDESIKEVVSRLKKFCPEIIFGYTQTIFFLAKYMNRYQIKIKNPKAIITTAETLTDVQRDFIEKQFKSKIFDQYGCGEVESIAYECEAHNGYHIVDEHVIVEILRNDGLPTEPGELGHILVTDLDNYVMPFIRYKNGDMGILSNSDCCCCGRGLSKIEKIEGRESDIILTNDGKVISIPSFYGSTAFKHIKGIEQYQVIQENIENVTIKIVTDENITSRELDHLYSITKDYLGGKMVVNIEKVHRIEPEENGKIKLVKSKVPLEEWLLKD